MGSAPFEVDFELGCEVVGEDRLLRVDGDMEIAVCRRAERRVTN